MRRVFVLVALLAVAARGDTNIIIPTQPSSSSTITTGTGTTPTPAPTVIQFRVTGNATSVKIRYSNERDGLIQTVTTLPFFTSFTSTADSAFVSLEVTPVVLANSDSPFLAAQIFVNGNLFREATSTSYFLNTISVDGTWRR